MHSYTGKSLWGSWRFLAISFLVSCLGALFVPALAVPSRTCVSTGIAGVQTASMSATATNVVFISEQTTSGNTTDQVYLSKNKATATAQFTANTSCFNPTISLDGSYIVYELSHLFLGSDIYKNSSAMLTGGFYYHPSIDYSGKVLTYINQTTNNVEVDNNGTIIVLGADDTNTVPVISANGQYVAYATGGNIHLFHIGSDAANSGGTIIASGSCSSPAIDYSGNRVAYVSGTNVKVYNRTSASVEYTVAGSDPAISAETDATKDGNYIAYVSGGNVYVYDLTLKTTRAYGTGSSPSVSADGNTVSLEDSGPDGNDIYVLTMFTVTPSAGTNGSISPNTPQTVDPGANVTFTATPNTGYVVDTWYLDGSPVAGTPVTGTLNQTYTVTNVQANHTVSVTFKTQTFTVTPSAGANGTISPNTPQSVDYNKNITFTAAPATGYLVDSWSVDGTTVQTGGTSYTLTNVLADHSVSVTFKIQTFTVTPSAGANGAISPNTAQTVDYGSNVSFTATPNSGYQVDVWQVDGTTVQTGGTSYTLSNITATHTVSVTFKIQTFTVTPSAGTNGSISPNTPQTVNYGSDITFTATPATGYLVGSWSVDGTTVQTGGSSYKLTNVTASHTVSVSFKIQTFSVTPSAGANGTISPNTAQTVNYGSNISFTATPSTGYQVDVWQVDGATVQTGGTSYTLSNVTAAHTVNVTFKLQTFTITPSAGSNGTISPNTAQTVNYASNISFTATPSTGYQVDVWQVDGATVQTGGTSYTLSNVTAAHTVNVTFKLQTFTVTPSAGSNGSISPNTAQIVDYGSNISFTATPNTGYLIGSWSVDGTTVQTGGTTYTLSNVTAAHTVSVTFTIQTFTVTPSAGSNGTINPNTAQTVNYGASQAFTATPNTGYQVDVWQVDGTTVQTGGTGYTLTNVTAAHTVNVTFKVQTFTVTASAGTGGTITPSGSKTVNYGGYVFYTATPSTGYGVNTWTVDGTTVQTGGLTYELDTITQNHTVAVSYTAYPAPTVTSITPNSHVNTGQLSVTNLAGTGFRTGVTVQLQQSGQPSITATNVQVVSSTQITCDFNFMNNATGAWDVVVTNDDGKSATLTAAVTLTQAPPAIVSITPNSGVNTGSVAITNLAGSGFVNPTVALQKTGQTPIPMTGVTLYGPTMITGSFDLTGAAAGAWDVVVTNSDNQSATLAGGFVIATEPAPAPTAVSPTSVEQPGVKTITVTGSNFTTDATVTLTKSGQADQALTISSRSATQLVGTIDISSLAVGQWNVVVTNHPSMANEQSATLPNALAITEAALTSVTLTTDKAWPQPTGATITLTATPTGSSSNVEYQFWARIFNQTTSQSEYILLRDYGTSNTFAWQPTSNNSYWLYVYARVVGSTDAYQVASPEVYYKIEVPTLTGVTLAVSPPSPQATGTPITLTATKTGTATDVEYSFVYKWYNSSTGSWQDGYIRGYETNNTCIWTPTTAGQYRLFVFARIVGHTALFDRISPYQAYTITTP